MYFVFMATYRTAKTIIMKLMRNVYPVTLKVQHKKTNLMAFHGRYEQRVVSNNLWPISVLFRNYGSVWRQVMLTSM